MPTSYPVSSGFDSTPSVKDDSLGHIASTKPTPALRLDSIDGLRGIACLLVMLGHSWIHFGLQMWPRLRFGSLVVCPTAVFTYGYGGVPVFFVLSGFCLSYPILSRLDRAPDWKQYAFNRFRRIMPPYWAAMVLFGAVSLCIRHKQITPLLSAHVDDWPGVHQLLLSIPLITSSFNSSFWTLMVEMRWYFLFPLLIIALSKVKSGIALTLLTIPVSLWSVYYLASSHNGRLQLLLYTVLTWLPLFGLGILAAQIVTRQRKSPWEQTVARHSAVGLLAGLILVAAYAPHWQMMLSDPHRAFVQSLNFRVVIAWSALSFFAVLSAAQAGRVQSLLSWKPLAQLGFISYSLYLVHEPIMHIAAAYLSLRRLSAPMTMLFELIVLPAVCIAFAWLFFQIAEKPFLRKSKANATRKAPAEKPRQAVPDLQVANLIQDRTEP